MNLLKDAGHVLATMAPTVATALGGPFAGMAVTQLEKVFGIDPAASADAKQSQLEQSLITATPDQLLALKKADHDFQVQMKTLGVTEQQLSYADTANARSREIAVKDSTPKILAYLTTAGFFAALAASMAFDIPAASKAIVFTMIGSLGTVWINQQGYYFGSSAGSAAKTDAINAIVTKK